MVRLYEAVLCVAVILAGVGACRSLPADWTVIARAGQAAVRGCNVQCT